MQDGKGWIPGTEKRKGRENREMPLAHTCVIPQTWKSEAGEFHELETSQSETISENKTGWEDDSVGKTAQWVIWFST